MLKTILIISVHLLFLFSAAQDNKDLSEFLENDRFSYSAWNENLNNGFGVLSNGDILFLEKLEGMNNGMNAKFMINNPVDGILNENRDFWVNKILQMGDLVLSNQDQKSLKNSIQELSLDENRSEIYLLVNDSRYTIFSVSIKETDMSTVILKIHINKY